MRRNVVSRISANTSVRASRTGSVVEVVAGNEVVGWTADKVAL
jgi:hypothetical protein